MPAIVVALLVVIAVLLVGGLLIGLALKLLWFALTGLVIGALARLVLPGRQQIGLLATALAGAGGSLLGGIVGDAMGLGGILQFVLAVALAALAITLFASAGRRAAA